MPNVLAFIRAGLGEIGRLVNRYRLRQELGEQDRKRLEALTRLGQRAWQAKIDLAAFGGLGEELHRSENRAGESAAAAKVLESEIAALQEHRRVEVAKFEALLSPILEAKAKLDSTLRATREQLRQKDQDIGAMETRVAKLSAELAKTELPPGVTREQQRSELKALSERLPGAKSTKASLAAEGVRLDSERQRCAAEVVKIEAERQAALSSLNADLARAQQGLSNVSKERIGLERQQADQFAQLGSAVFERKLKHETLADGIQAVTAIDQARASVLAGLEASLALTRAMPPQTMLKFWAALLVPVLAIGIGYGVYSSSGSDHHAKPSDPGRSSTPSARPGMEPVKQEESKKDMAVDAFIRSPAKGSKRTEAIKILTEDIRTLGGTADPSHLPNLIKILKSSEPELRAAAGHAIGMIGPGPSEMPILIGALNDPVPAVRHAVLLGLSQLRSNTAARLLVRRVNVGGTQSRNTLDTLDPEPVPDPKIIGVPLYEGATFLHFASNVKAGCAAYSTSDPPQKVIDFYATRSGVAPQTAEEFTRTYSAVSCMPLVRYSEGNLYGNPKLIALEVTEAGGTKRAVRFVAVFEDRALARTGFQVHFEPVPR